MQQTLHTISLEKIVHIDNFNSCLLHAEKCHYRYLIEPGSTNETCSLENFDFLILECQVSSNLLGKFSIEWHHSYSRPDNTTVNNANVSFNFHKSKLVTTKSNMTVTSQLMLTEFRNGYYWCSVNSSANILTSNPSTVSHIRNNTKCSENKQRCKGIQLHSVSYTDRCADHELELRIIEAQTCSEGPHLVTTEISKSSKAIDPSASVVTSQSCSEEPHLITTEIPKSSEAIDPSTSVVTPQSKFQQTTTTNTSEDLSPTQNMWIVIGASLGGLSLVLILIICLLMTCGMRMRLKRHTSKHGTDQRTSFDDIRIHSSMAKGGTSDDGNRSSKMFHETITNVSYECLQDMLSQQQQSQNIYEYIN